MAVRARRCGALACGALALLLAACGSDSRYHQDTDSAPRVRLDPAAIRDAVPRPEPIREAGNRSPYRVLGKTYHVMAQDEARGYRERGLASWYGTKFHGYQTSNGEVYDMYAMSAAHKSLPIPCYVRVTNLDNGRSAIVRVNDRGPFHGSRLIDLSYAAATKLGYVDRGTANVEIAVLDTTGAPQAAAERPAQPVGAPRRFLQAAAFSERDRAEQLRQRLTGLLQDPVVIAYGGAAHPAPYRVRIGPLQAAADEQRVRDLLAAEQLGSPYAVAE